MEFKKILSDPLESVFAVSHLQHPDAEFLLVASEGKEGACFAYDVGNQFSKQLVWEGSGGTKSIVQVPNSLDFIATQGFYPEYDGAHCQLVYGHYQDGSWEIRPLMHFPYLHRFDLVQAEDGKTIYFIGATIANSKLFPEDWLDRGKLHVGYFDQKSRSLRGLQELPVRLLKNHGYFSVKEEGYSLIASADGVFKLEYPTKENPDWNLEQIFHEETSDVVEVDWTGPDAKDKAIIQGFYGDRFRVLNAVFQQEVYRFPSPTPFGHALWAGYLAQKASILFGYREGKAELILLQMKEDGIESQVVEAGVGASNVLGFSVEGDAYIFSANHGQNQVVLYQILE
ncbi:hypothetical protein JEQ21_05645 [Streptococcus sp. 121]|uniref:hypothetical protein n=1 Tax=Streptococcus sp. 121 TaxID=2797637 RepID=UPI0018F0E9E3|nr:hypothetical protein [Streptococcus sp. 121]MBJ6745939.1 hypothetical protein [Streptococcus sp. 121]